MAVGLAPAGTAAAVPAIDGVRAVAWGANGAGQLGDGTLAGRPVPGQVTGMLDGVRQVSAGTGHSLALLSDGDVWSWGDNGYGQLGDGGGPDRAAPVRVVGLSGVRQVAAGDQHSIAVKTDGTVWTWGANGRGRLGDGTVTTRPVPVQVPGISTAVQVAAGAATSYAVLANGYVLAWGSNSYGQIGDGTTVDRLLPVPVADLNGATQVAAGSFHAVALRAVSGTVYGWGYNQHGGVGDGTTAPRWAPVPVPGLNNVTAVAAGGFFSLALVKDKTVWGWGNNGHGQLGYFGGNRLNALPIIGISSVTQVSGGYNHVLAVRTDGSLWSWGANGTGQLGDGTLTERAVPAKVPGLKGVRSADAGQSHSMAVLREPDVIGLG